MIPNPWVIVGLLVGWGASLAGVFWFGTSYESGQEAERKVVIEQAVKVATAANQKFADDLGTRVETSLGKIRITNTTIQQEVRHEVETKLVDNPDCRIPVSVVRLLNRSRIFGEDGPGAGELTADLPSAGNLPGGRSLEGVGPDKR